MKGNAPDAKGALRRLDHRSHELVCCCCSPEATKRSSRGLRLKCGKRTLFMSDILLQSKEKIKPKRACLCAHVDPAATEQDALDFFSFLDYFCFWIILLSKCTKPYKEIHLWKHILFCACCWWLNNTQREVHSVIKTCTGVWNGNNS